MSQTRAGSALEAVMNVVIGFQLAVVAQQMVFPLFGLSVPLATHLGIAFVFTVLSLLRSYVLRRLFDRMGER